MTVHGAQYRIVVDVPGVSLVIRDMGSWNLHPTVTNDAEHVVVALVKLGKLPPGRRLFYYDSFGDLDEILVKDGRFAGFGPGRGEAAS